jgi:hypothetical protein
MRRKPGVKAESLVPEEILERAKKAFEPETRTMPPNCVICGSPCAPTSTEGLCWVCRRLKISAWRENDQQMPAQE